MKRKTHFLPIVLTFSLFTQAFGMKSFSVTSPDEKISVQVSLTKDGEPFYFIKHSGDLVLKESRLGLVRSDEDFTTGLTVVSVSDVKLLTDDYTLLHGKRLNCHYAGNQRIISLKNIHSKIINIIFQVSNDGIAFRYQFPENSEQAVRIYKETTSFHFDTETKTFIQHCPDARMGWCFDSPCYEEHYRLNLPVGTPAPNQAGWVMPALFNFEKYWISITETGVDTNYCGSRLSQFSPDGEYAIQFPQPQEGRAGEPVLPESILPWTTPWRVIAITDNLADLVESTLETDLAAPAKYDVSSWLKPGVASWSWIILKDDSTIFDVQREYIDFAASMHWEYCLIDAFWDTQIGYDKIKELSDYAKTKDVKLLLWYNSSGDWNTTVLSPKDKMLTKDSRRSEFKMLQEVGIAGIKVDFFAGDGQSMMKYYIDILKDAAQYKLAVNFHGCTFPRSWYRTYPNLVSMEAIKGEEFVTFEQSNADHQPSHCAVIPFTRNLFDPMDFTPVNFSGIPNITRRTTNGFELALSVLFTSGIQHMAEIPSGMAAQPDFVRDFIRTIPETWDDVKFIDGFPGQYVILARKKGDTWMISGINGENVERDVSFRADFIQGIGMMISDSETSGDWMRKEMDLSTPVRITMKPYGGFVIKIN